MSSPRVSVVLPVYNGEEYLRRAIESVLRQNYQDLELLVIDDASGDGSVRVVETFNDPRIRLIRNALNLGLTDSLNIGVKAARGAYIARIDQDDYFDHPDKLLRQVEWLDQHPDCVLVGTYFTVYTPGQKPIKITPPTEDADLRRGLLLSATFAHPTVMFRKSVCVSVGGYRNRFGKHVEDIDLWFRLGLHGTFHILPVFGLNYYKSAGGISRKYERQQAWNTLRLALGNIHHWARYPGLPTGVWKSAKRFLLLSAGAMLKPIRRQRR